MGGVERHCTDSADRPFANTGELLAELGQTQPRHITALREWREQARRSRWSMATWWRKQQSITKGKAYDAAIALETWKELKKTLCSEP